MTKLEKISAIVGLIVIGASIFSRYLYLQEDVKTLQNKQQLMKRNITNNLEKIMELDSYSKKIDSNIKNNKDWIDYLQEKIDNRQDSIESSMKETYQLLKKIAEKKK